MTLIAVIWLGLAIATGAAARSRGRSGIGWFLLAMIFSPLIALILLMAFRPRHVGPSKKCRFCRSEVDRLAMVCPHCQREILTEEEIEKEKAAVARANKEGWWVGLGLVAFLALVAFLTRH